MEWPEEEVRLYAKYRKSLKSKSSSKSKPSAPPPPADSVPSSQPSPRGDIQSQVDSLNVTVTSLAETLTARLNALTASLLATPVTQLSSQPRLGPDVGEPQPGVTAGTRRTFQALGVPDGTPAVPPNAYHPLGQGVRAPASELLGSSSAPQPQAAPGAAPPPSASSAFWGSAQPSTSGWVPSDPPPTRSARDSRTSSESEASDAARRSKPLSHIIPTRSHRYAVADDPLFASSHPVNPSFAQLMGARTVGSKRWGSISYSKMERMERLFLT